MICADKSFANYRTEESARFYLKRYFNFFGVPEEKCTSQRYVDMCLSTDVLSGTQRAYEAMAGHERFRDSEESTHSISRDVRFVVKTLAVMSRLVPQELSMGMLLAHLEIIEGLTLRTQP